MQLNYIVKLFIRYDTIEEFNVDWKAECACVVARDSIRGVYSCSSLGWPAWWPDLYLGRGKNSGWHNTWLSKWCNLTPAMWYHQFYMEARRGAQLSQGAVPPGHPLEPPLYSIKYDAIACPYVCLSVSPWVGVHGWLDQGLSIMGLHSYGEQNKLNRNFTSNVYWSDQQTVEVTIKLILFTIAM